MGHHKVVAKPKKSLNDVFNRRNANNIDSENNRLLKNLRSIKGMVPTVGECRRNH